MPDFSPSAARRIAELEARLSRLEQLVQSSGRDPTQGLQIGWHWAVLAEDLLGRRGSALAYLAFQTADAMAGDIPVGSDGNWWLTTETVPVWPGYYPAAGETIEAGRGVMILWQPPPPKRRHGRWYVVGAACPVDYYS